MPVPDVIAHFLPIESRRHAFPDTPFQISSSLARDMTDEADERYTAPAPEAPFIARRRSPA